MLTDPNKGFGVFGHEIVDQQPCFIALIYEMRNSFASKHGLKYTLEKIEGTAVDRNSKNKLREQYV